MVLLVGLLGFFTWAGVGLGSWLGDLGVRVGEIAADHAPLDTARPGLRGSRPGPRRSHRKGPRGLPTGAAGAAVAAYLANSMLPLNDSLAEFAKALTLLLLPDRRSPGNGIDWSHAAVLAGLDRAVLIGLSLVLFERRDLR